MPKKNGVSKTYSFDKSVLQMLEDLCNREHRTQTNMIEMMIIEKHTREVICNEQKDGETEN